MRYLLLLLIILCSLACHPETFSVDKPGKLSQILKKQNVKDIKSIKINGAINSSDIKALTKLSSLESLDFRDADLLEFKSEKFKFPKLTLLNTLRVSSKFAHNKTFDISELGNIKTIETPASNLFLGLATNLIDTLIINDNSFISSTHPVIVAQVIIKCLYKVNSHSYEPSLIPNNIDVLVYKNVNGSQAIHVTDNNMDLLEQCDEINNNCIWEITKKKIYLGNIKTIGANAFKGSPITEIKLSATIKTIDAKTFNYSNVKYIEFTQPLQDNNFKVHFPDDITVTIPKGSYKNFSSIIKSPIFEKGETRKKYVIVTEEKRLPEQLSVDSLFQLDTLSIEGTATLSDLKVLENARNLRVLDLRKCKLLKDKEIVYKEKREFAYNFLKDLWTETLNNIYTIRDRQTEEQMAYALMGYIASEAKDKSKIEYENGDFVAIFNYYMAKSLEEDAKVNYKKRNNISKEEQDAIKDFNDNYNKVLAITGINENLMEYMLTYVPNTDYGGKYLYVKEETMIERCKELMGLFKVSGQYDVHFLNEYDPIYRWQKRPEGYYRHSRKGLSNLSAQWRSKSFMKLENDMKKIESVPLILEEFSFIPSLNRIIR